MQLPGMLIEYLITGACAIPWLYLLVLISTGKPLRLPLEFKLDAGLVALLVPIIYVVGMIIDFLALVLVKRIQDYLINPPLKLIAARIPWIQQYIDPTQPSSSRVSDAKLLLRSPEVGKELVLRSSRDRVARGAFMNSLIATGVALAYVAHFKPFSEAYVWGVGVFAISLCYATWHRFEKHTLWFKVNASDAIIEDESSKAQKES